MIAKLLRFIEETKGELRKVTWPTREETLKLTRTVIIISILVSAYLGFLDFAFSESLNFVLTKF